LNLSQDYNIESLCETMNVSRSGYYKWLKRKDTLNRYELQRENLKEIVLNYYKQSPTWGYRRVNKQIKKNYGWIVSDNLVWKARNELGLVCVSRIKTKTQKPGNDHKIYPNLIKGNFEANSPFEKVCTDTTMIGHKGKVYDLNLYVDLFNLEIISYDLTLSNFGHSVGNHHRALKSFLLEKQKRGYIDVETILHSDQGPIYTSRAFNAHLDDTPIIRSMSRAGTPTDNPVIESFNGWMKDELEYDFKYKDRDCIFEVIDEYIKYHNQKRLSFKLEYKSPISFRSELGYK